jgi:hypothetical protein
VVLKKTNIFALALGKLNAISAKIGSLAQLVQSICLTSRGSGVRTPQLPHIKEAFLASFFYAINFQMRGEKFIPSEMQ